MRGIFCGTSARNIEEYRVVVKKRMYLYMGLVALGLLTILIGVLIYQMMPGSIDDHTLGFLMGVGSGLTAGGAVMCFKTKGLMKNEEKLNQDRLKYKDERIQEIGSKALRTTAAVILLALYVVLIIAAIFYEGFIWPVLGLIAVFFITYQVSYVVYSKKM